MAMKAMGMHADFLDGYVVRNQVVIDTCLLVELCVRIGSGCNGGYKGFGQAVTAEAG